MNAVKAGLAIAAALFLADCPISVEGSYRCVGNPCSTYPCLPGMVWAVYDGTTHYYLTADGSWVWGCEETSWAGYTPVEGEMVLVTGYQSVDTDMLGYEYCNLEVISMEGAE